MPKMMTIPFCPCLSGSKPYIHVLCVREVRLVTHSALTSCTFKMITFLFLMRSILLRLLSLGSPSGSKAPVSCLVKVSAFIRASSVALMMLATCSRRALGELCPRLRMPIFIKFSSIFCQQGCLSEDATCCDLLVVLLASARASSSCLPVPLSFRSSCSAASIEACCQSWSILSWADKAQSISCCLW